MAIKAVLDSLDGVDDGLKGLYVESEGKYRIDIEGGFKTPAEMEGLTSALGKEREQNKAHAKLLKAFEGLDAAAARDALAKVANWDENQQKAAEKMEADLQARLAPLTTERDKYKSQFEEAHAKIDSFTIESAIRNSKAFEKVEDPIYRDHLQQIVRANLKMQDGALVGFKPDGSQVFDTNGNPAQGDELVSAIVKSIPNVERYFAGSKAQGSGAQPSGGYAPKGSMRRSEFDKLNAAEKYKAAKDGVKVVDD